MRSLLIAVGNPLRSDDGVAHAVLELLDGESRSLLQLTPEVAEDIACYDRVIFLDADASATEPSIEPVREFPSHPALTHVSTPAAIVALSRGLFGFAGQALLCRIPATDLSPGGTLTPQTRMIANDVARALVRAMFALMRTPGRLEKLPR